MSYRVVRNTSESPVEVDEEGRVAHPGDWTAVLENPVLMAAIASGQVLDRTDTVTEKSDPAAREAMRAGQAMAKAQAAKPPADPRPADTMSGKPASPADPQ